MIGKMTEAQAGLKNVPTTILGLPGSGAVGCGQRQALGIGVAMPVKRLLLVINKQQKTAKCKVFDILLAD